MEDKILKQVFQLIGIISIIAFLHGCDETKTSKDMIMDAMNDQDSTTENTDIQIPACKVGDVLSIGQVCMDEGTDAIFSVLDNGIASYTSSSGLLNEATDVLDATGQTLNDQSYNFIARKQDDGHWKIERVTSTMIEE